MKISKLKEKMFFSGLILLCAFIMYIFKIPCIFRAILGVPCPGCGITRAYICVFNLDFQKAFELNFMFWSVPVLFVIYILDGKIFKKRLFNLILEYLIYLGFLVSWICRLI